MHSLGSATSLLDKGWTLSQSEVALGERQLGGYLSMDRRACSLHLCIRNGS